MLAHLSVFTSTIFVLTTLLTLFLFYWAARRSETELTRKKAIPVTIGLSAWLILQALLSLQNVYNSDLNALPPKIILFGIFPVAVIILVVFLTKKGLLFIDGLSLKHITYLHAVRVPVELVLFWLFQQKFIPELMTFEGRNFDIIAGITAPLIAYFGLAKGKLNRKIILIWNILCLGLLLNIVVHAALAIPSPMQQLAFDQPNVAILYFPVSWLPTFIVPVVFFCHLVSIRRLSRQK